MLRLAVSLTDVHRKSLEFQSPHPPHIGNRMQETDQSVNQSIDQIEGTDQSEAGVPGCPVCGAVVYIQYAHNQEILLSQQKQTQNLNLRMT